MNSSRLPPLAGLLAVFLLYAVSTALPGARAAVYDPALVWRTVSTPHFRIHHHQELTAEALDLAEVAEEVHGPMVDLLGWEPAAPTEVVLVDNTDQANGYTTVLPYNRIVLFPVRPAMGGTLGDYREWLRMLFVHEYAHVLGLDPVRGYSALTRAVFGRVGIPATPYGALFWFLAAPPNLFLPPWFHEGLATNLETDFTGGGRKGSTFYHMIYRMDVAESRVPPLDRLGGDYPAWPSYSTRYIYGTRMLQVVQEEHGADTYADLIRGHAGRAPYAIDAPPERVSGGDYTDLYRRMVRGLEEEYRPEIRRLEALGLTSVTPLTRSGHFTVAPLWLDDDRLVYTHSDRYRPPELRLLDLRGGLPVSLCRRPGNRNRPTRLDAGGLVFPRIEVSRPYAGGNRYTDLYRLDGLHPRRRPRRLTHGGRILEADYSAVRDRFVAVQVIDGRHHLVLLTREGERDQVLLGEPRTRYGAPRWSPDGGRLVFSRKTDGGHARLALLHLESGEIHLLTPPGSQAGFPTWHPDGSRVAFVWDRSGVFDLYQYDLTTGGVLRLTRLLGGALEPDWSPDGTAIAFSHYTARGFDVALLHLENALKEPVPDAPPMVRLSPDAFPASEAGPSQAGTPYSAWPRVLPTFWLPDLQADHRGQAPGAWTAGHDPLLRHKYYGAGFWAPRSRRFYGQAVYVNDAGYPTVTVHARKLPRLHADLFETADGDLDYWEEERRAGVELQLELPRALRRWSFAVGWAWEELERLSRTDEELNGRRDLAAAANQGRINPLIASFLFDSRFPYDNRFTVGPEQGRRLEVSYRHRSTLWGSELERRELVATWREYLPLVRDRHWVLALRATAATSWGEQTPQAAFQVGGVDTELPVRGYPARVSRGRRAVAGGGEVRFPLWQPYRGLRDLPLFLSKLHGAVFLDGGRTWDGGQDAWRRGTGAELRADTLLGYYLPTTLVLGWARGFGEDGETQAYFTVRGVL